MDDDPNILDDEVTPTSVKARRWKRKRISAS